MGGEEMVFGIQSYLWVGIGFTWLLTALSFDQWRKGQDETDGAIMFGSATLAVGYTALVAVSALCAAV